MAARVADASVLAALVFEEARGAEAEELLRGADLYEPTLMPYELASVARKKIGLDPDQEAAILRALELLAMVPFRWVVVNQRESVRLSVYDAQGRLVVVLVEAEQETGWHEVMFEAGTLSSGLYFYRLEAGAFKDTRAMLLVK